MLLGLLCLGAGPAPNQTPVPIHFLIKTAGCGASDLGKPMYLSLSHFDNLGSLIEGPELKVSGAVADVAIPPGYYDAELSSRGCWEQSNWFSVLPGLSRTIEVHNDAEAVTLNTDILVYEFPHGAVAGTIPGAVSKVLIVRRRQPDYVIAPKVELGAYYADDVPPGRYIVRATMANDVKEVTVDVKDDTLQTVNFTLGDFDLVRSGTE
jgi:hypothetical protein